MAGDIVVRGEYNDIFEFSYSNVVKITVGLYIPCELAVDRKLICDSSGLIKEALSDVTCREVKLDKVELMDFKIYLNWLYTDILGTKYARMQEEFKLLAELYFLGLKIKDVRFQNNIITAMVDKSQEHLYEDLPGIECIKLAYEGYHDTSA
ncbi:hypothetical protein M409DRAFT_52106 [Zasmidium cellare ATCC 36951]|uniref:BTB domain-containing protein n=1 Tax=Zasmidium cellare ATCC 36951 TaxID=1080233 RepID=A0A6A6CUR5_ZASCE|nr:uncharacterized protein M409DRAFT_52106 [Zasmidium cellare ATCC 36951]KAF2169572.1 hypothetical protein M409DRAFT_52106 [Zasmidium cellare ATCC 36951]